MTKSVGLLQETINEKLYTKEDYINNPKDYCGIKVTDSPLE